MMLKAVTCVQQASCDWHERSWIYHMWSTQANKFITNIFHLASHKHTTWSDSWYFLLSFNHLPTAAVIATLAATLGATNQLKSYLFCLRTVVEHNKSNCAIQLTNRDVMRFDAKVELRIDVSLINHICCYVCFALENCLKTFKTNLFESKCFLTWFLAFSWSQKIYINKKNLSIKIKFLIVALTRIIFDSRAPGVNVYWPRIWAQFSLGSCVPTVNFWFDCQTIKHCWWASWNELGKSFWWIHRRKGDEKARNGFGNEAISM